ncbi:hypothetical protein VN97_g13062 [Penicillium thymicola]|uniref:Uncharacterized protein n=1 Tax=Penicillium thymicola TaxID=293382 RepID=A0AAI9T5A6_PENTH|nr:hypothetical protein VN97_g13062 [Penicillium thymicola]
MNDMSANMNMSYIRIPLFLSEPYRQVLVQFDYCCGFSRDATIPLSDGTAISFQMAWQNRVVIMTRRMLHTEPDSVVGVV